MLKVYIMLFGTSLKKSKKQDSAALSKNYRILHSQKNFDIKSSEKILIILNKLDFLFDSASSIR